MNSFYPDDILMYHSKKSLQDSNNDIIIKNLQNNIYKDYQEYVLNCISLNVIPVVYSKFTLYNNKC